MPDRHANAEAIATLSTRIEELETAIDTLKAGVLMYPLNKRLGLKYDLPRCRWLVGGCEYRQFDAALVHAIRDLCAAAIATAGASIPVPLPSDILPPPLTTPDQMRHGPAQEVTKEEHDKLLAAMPKNVDWSKP